MAYLNEDEEETKGQGLNQTLAQTNVPPQGQQPEQAPEQGSQPATISSTPSAPAAPATQQKQQKAGTGTFTNLKNYLQANQGNRIASAASQRVANVATGAQKGIQQAQNVFGQRVEQGSLKNMNTAQQEAQNIIKGAASTTYQAPQAAQPQTLVSPEQQQRFAEIINAQYKGPQSLQEAGLYNPAAERVRVAQNVAKQTQSAGGRQDLLTDIYGRQRDYTRGQSQLDALLLNTSQAGVSQLQQQGQQAAATQPALQQAQSSSSALAQQRRAAIEKIRGDVRSDFTGTQSAQEQAINKRIEDLTTKIAVDEQGNKIQKLDNTGKPMVDAAGNPVYLTEWERLPDYFRQSLANRGESSEKIKQERIAALNAQFKPQTDQISQLTQSLKDLEARKKRADYIKALGTTFIDTNDRRAYDQAVAGQRNAIRESEELGNLINQQRQSLSALQSSPEFKQYQEQLKAAESINKNQWILSPEEAAILGVSAGEGLYNLTPDIIRTAEADRTKLISKDELTRLQALSQLAGADTSEVGQRLKTQILGGEDYNLEKAGTQNAMSALDTEALRNALNEAQGLFKQSAEQADLTGTGKKKVSRGNWAGKKTKTYYADVKGNVADMLRQAGYDVGSEGQARSLLSNQDLLNRFLGNTDTTRAEEGNVGFSGVEGAAAGAGTGASIGSLIPGVGTAIGAAIGAGIGGSVGTNTLDPFQRDSDMLKEMEEKLGIKGLGAVGQGIQDVRGMLASPTQGLANMVGNNVFGDVLRGISGFTSGIDTGAMKAFGSAKAKQNAIEDLQRKYAQYLQGQGFENRTAIADTDTTRARATALRALLASRDKTNV